MSAKQALARNMLKANLPLQQIIDITGFSKEDLEKYVLTKTTFLIE